MGTIMTTHAHHSSLPVLDTRNELPALSFSVPDGARGSLGNRPRKVYQRQQQFERVGYDAFSGETPEQFIRRIDGPNWTGRE